jgi:hypothetical protein
MSKNRPYRLIEAFATTFRGREYRHRKSTQGDLVAIHLYEDLHDLGFSMKLKERIDSQRCVLNLGNTLRGIAARRGDGTFGTKIPHIDALLEPGFAVARGPLATIEIGIEFKILAKAMIKQIDRVGSDLRGQVEHFHKGGGNPISIGIVGINHAQRYTSFEGERPFPTDGKKYKHPFQEAASALTRLEQDAKPVFDEFLFLHFRATNSEPFPFEWVDEDATLADYGAVLVRIAQKYDSRF